MQLQISVQVSVKTQSLTEKPKNSLSIPIKLRLMLSNNDSDQRPNRVSKTLFLQELRLNLEILISILQSFVNGNKNHTIHAEFVH